MQNHSQKQKNFTTYVLKVLVHKNKDAFHPHTYPFPSIAQSQLASATLNVTCSLKLPSDNPTWFRNTFCKQMFFHLT